jgi:hypothetical protein
VKVLFNVRAAKVHNRWFETKKGLLADSLEKELMYPSRRGRSCKSRTLQRGQKKA